MNNSYFLYIVLPMCILGITGISVMVYTSAYIWLFATFIFWILLSGLGIAVGYHRIYSHQCYNLKPWLDKFILACGVLACQTSSITWVSTHIGYHHPYSDTDKDPHTPIKGIFNAFLGWTFYITETSISYKYAAKLLRKPHHLFVHKHYFKIVWAWVIVAFIMFGWKFTLFGYCIAAMISVLQDNLINVVGHLPSVGYRNYNLNDQSSNFPTLGYFGWGQGWHNNHHYAPKAFDFGKGISGKWWEFDPCIIFIPLLKLGSIPNNK